MLDLRLPIGWLFITMGTMVLLWGYTHPVATTLGAQSINLNITWGSVMGMFGLFMIMLGYREKS